MYDRNNLGCQVRYHISLTLSISVTSSPCNLTVNCHRMMTSDYVQKERCSSASLTIHPQPIVPGHIARLMRPPTRIFTHNGGRSSIIELRGTPRCPLTPPCRRLFHHCQMSKRASAFFGSTRGEYDDDRLPRRRTRRRIRPDSIANIGVSATNTHTGTCIGQVSEGDTMSQIPATTYSPINTPITAMASRISAKALPPTLSSPNAKIPTTNSSNAILDPTTDQVVMASGNVTTGSSAF